SLRLGGAIVGAGPWPGPTTVIETEDGATVRVLSAAAVEGLTHIGADVDAAVIALLGARDLDAAPGVSLAPPRERGFTDHELSQVQAALPFAADFSAVFSANVLGEGFLRDVLGASAEALEDPDLDVLALTGFDPAEIASARAHVFGSGA